MKNPTCLLLQATPRATVAIPQPPPEPAASDFEAAALYAMQDGYAIRTELVRATLQAGCAELTGTVQWQYQKDGATRCVQSLPGVRSVSNRLTLLPSDHGMANGKGHALRP